MVFKASAKHRGTLAQLLSTTILLVKLDRVNIFVRCGAQEGLHQGLRLRFVSQLFDGLSAIIYAALLRPVNSDPLLFQIFRPYRDHWANRIELHRALRVAHKTVVGLHVVGRCHWLLVDLQETDRTDAHVDHSLFRHVAQILIVY